jgi:hypothetical protein
MIRVNLRSSLLRGLMCGLALCLCLIAVSPASSTAPSVAWSKQYDGDDMTNVVATTIYTTNDGGYVIAGYAEASDSNLDSRLIGGDKIYVSRIDTSGNELWHHLYGRPGKYSGQLFDNAHANSIVQTRDGGYIVAGQSGEDLCLFKISADGAETPQWSQVYPGLWISEGYSVRQTSDGGYIVTGDDSINGGNGADVYLVKTDADGVLQWSRHFGGTGDEYGWSVRQTPDGGYVIVGDEDSYTPDRSIYLIKTDVSGNLLWNRSYGGQDYTRGYDVIPAGDGGYVVTGTISLNIAHPHYDVLIKADANGNILWERKYTIAKIGEARSLQQTGDGGYLIGGWRQDDSDTVSLSVIRTDDNGTMLWNRSSDTQTWAESVVHGAMTNDGGYILAGFTINDDLHNLKKALVVKFANADSAGAEVTASESPGYTATPANGQPSSTAKPVNVSTPGMEGLMAILALSFALVVRSSGKR